MNRDDARKLIQDTVLQIAPDLDADELTDEADLRQDLDLDSMDFLNVVTALHEKTGLDIPEADYPRIQTIGGCAAYLEEKGA